MDEQLFWGYYIETDSHRKRSFSYNRRCDIEWMARADDIVLEFVAVRQPPRLIFKFLGGSYIRS